MVRLEHHDEHERAHLLDLPCPSFDHTPYVTGLNLERARIAVVSTAGLHRRSDRPFAGGEAGYRVLPVDVGPGDLLPVPRDQMHRFQTRNIFYTKPLTTLMMFLLAFNR